MSPKQDAPKSPSRRRGSNGRSSGFSAEERAAMRERARELKAESARGRGTKSDVDPNAEVLEKIAKMEPTDRAMAERVHALITAAVPELVPRLWYGMPAYSKDGKTICFFKDAHKFKARYATLGFSDKANLDDGAMWPTDYALTKLTPAVEARITELVKQAVN